MDAVNQRLTQFVSQWQRFITLTWYILRSPRTTGVLLAVLAIVLLLGLIIPQQSEPVGDDLLFSLGFSKIFQTLWFWLPVALLLLNSLIALADYAPGSWRRLDKTIPPLEWQHPLARRVEHSVRLPSLPDDFLETLKKLLQEKGFSLYEPAESEQRVTGAALRRWAWLGVVACYVGLIVLIGAFLMTYYASKTERFTLLPFEPQAPVLFEGEFELTEAESMRMSRVAYAPPGVAQSPQMLTWRLYQPSFLNNTLIFPIAIEPILTIEVRDSTGALLGLEPLQEEISQPIEQLNLPLDESNSPRYFAIPAVNLAVQVSPDSREDENVFNVQVVVHDSGELLLEKRGIQPGQVFDVENYSAVMFLNHSVSVVARRDPAWPLYLVSIILILTGLSLTFLQPPALVWLVPEVKGLGGQLYGVMEKFGAEEKMVRFLEELLAVEVSSEKQEVD